jgi:multidrug efflux pump subunit AcrB
MVQAEGRFRNSLTPILDMQVRNANGKMVAFRSFATISNQMGPETITRFNQYQTTPLMLIPMPGRSTGQAIRTVENIVKDMPDYGLAWSGMSFQEKSVGAEQYIVFAMSIIFAFFVLSALYESWSLPLIIMMAVPLGVAGALAAVALCGMPITMYTQVGLMIMVGLSAKNAILITEVAHELRVHEKMSVSEAAIAAGHRRMRPIMMTSYAFILGVIPLALATGAGAMGRNAIGSAVCGGMLNETMIGIFVTPTLFILFQMYSEGFAKLLKKIIGETGNDGT